MPAPEQIQWFGRTDRGKVRQNNEDCFLCLEFDGQEVRYLGKMGSASTTAKDFVFAVSDGMGGGKAGELASRITVDKITHLLPPAFKQSASGMIPGFADILTELFREIHRALLFVGGSYEECAGMGATLSLCWFTPGWMYFAHVGDSRIYYLPAAAGLLKQVTEDDTHVGWLFRNGELNERQARQHPRRTVLQKALGAGHQFVDPQIGAVNCEIGDRFLLCTDGLVEGIYDDRINQLLCTPNAVEAELNPAERLIAASLEQCGRDNTSAVVVEIT